MMAHRVTLNGPMLRQHGFEPPLHPFKRAAQFDDNGPVRQARTVMWWDRKGTPNLTLVVFSAPTKEPKTESTDRERRNPCGEGNSQSSDREARRRPTLQARRRRSKPRCVPCELFWHVGDLVPPERQTFYDKLPRSDHRDSGAPAFVLSKKLLSVR